MRPKREAAKRASYVINYFAHDYDEENELKKAIKASLGESPQVKANNDSHPRSSYATNSLESNQSETLSVNTKPTKNKKDHKSSSSNSTSKSKSTAKLKEKVRGKVDDTDTPYLGVAKKTVVNPPSRKSLRSRLKRSSTKSDPFSKLKPTNELFPYIEPNTKDFLSFICFRRSHQLPPEWDMPALNEKAKREQMAKNQSSTKSTNQTSTKQVTSKSASIYQPAGTSQPIESIKLNTIAGKTPVNNGVSVEASSNEINAIKSNGENVPVVTIESDDDSSCDDIPSDLSEGKINQKSTKNVQVKAKLPKFSRKRMKSVTDDNVNILLKRTKLTSQVRNIEKSSNVRAKTSFRNANRLKTQMKLKRLRFATRRGGRGFLIDKVIGYYHQIKRRLYKV